MMNEGRSAHYTLLFIYFTYSQNIQINLLLQSKALVTECNKEVLITKTIGKEKHSDTF